MMDEAPDVEVIYENIVNEPRCAVRRPISRMRNQPPIQPCLLPGPPPMRPPTPLPTGPPPMRPVPNPGPKPPIPPPQPQETTSEQPMKVEVNEHDLEEEEKSGESGSEEDESDPNEEIQVVDELGPEEDIQGIGESDPEEEIPHTNERKSYNLRPRKLSQITVQHQKVGVSLNNKKKVSYHQSKPNPAGYGTRPQMPGSNIYDRKNTQEVNIPYPNNQENQTMINQWIDPTPLPEHYYYRSVPEDQMITIMERPTHHQSVRESYINQEQVSYNQSTHDTNRRMAYQGCSKTRPQAPYRVQDHWDSRPRNVMQEYPVTDPTRQMLGSTPIPTFLRKVLEWLCEQEDIHNAQSTQTINMMIPNEQNSRSQPSLPYERKSDRMNPYVEANFSNRQPVDGNNSMPYSTYENPIMLPSVYANKIPFVQENPVMSSNRMPPSNQFMRHDQAMFNDRMPVQENHIMPSNNFISHEEPMFNNCISNAQKNLAMPSNQFLSHDEAQFNNRRPMREDPMHLNQYMSNEVLYTNRRPIQGYHDELNRYNKYASF